MLVGAQLYVYTQECRRLGREFEPALDDILGEVHAAGYEAVEGLLPFCATPEGADRWRALLRRHGLQAPSLYTGGNLYESAQAEETVQRIVASARLARPAGCQALTVNPDVRRARKSQAELREQARWLNRLGGELDTFGVALWVHNHDAEMRDDARELRANLDSTDPALVGFCADLHWIWRGGGDPYAFLERYPSRLGSLHLRNSRQSVWSEELGDGDVDYRRVAAILRAQQFEGPLIVELAIEAGTPRTRPLSESLRISRDYVRAVFEA